MRAQRLGKNESLQEAQGKVSMDLGLERRAFNCVEGNLMAEHLML